MLVDCITKDDASKWRLNFGLARIRHQMSEPKCVRAHVFRTGELWIGDISFEIKIV